MLASISEATKPGHVYQFASCLIDRINRKMFQRRLKLQEGNVLFVFGNRFNKHTHARTHILKEFT